MNRRQFLRTAVVLSGAAAVGGCGSAGGSAGGSARLLAPSDPRVAEREAARAAGNVVQIALRAAEGEVDLGGRVVRSWTYGSVPGKPIRVRRGDVLVATLDNRLPDSTSVHWHGLALRNDMDGMPPVTQSHIPAGTSFTYRYIADRPGTYWFHPHTGTQLDRGLYAAMIVEDPDERVAYDDEWVVVLDDWLDGTGRTPEDILAELRTGMGHHHEGHDGHDMDGMHDMAGMDMAGMDHGAAPASASASAPTPAAGVGGNPAGMLMGAVSSLLGGDAGDVSYPYHLLNGRVATDPEVYRAKPGRRVRIRVVNAGSDTGYRFAVGGHTLTVTHTDGYPVAPVETDSVLIGMGERYDVVVTLKDGVFPVVALAEGKNALARALIRTGAGRPPAAGARPAELARRVTSSGDLAATPEVALPRRGVDREYRLELTGGMAQYDWGINGVRFDHEKPLLAEPFLVSQGERVRLTFANKGKMWHPMHLHGHTYQVGTSGPRKDTVIVLPKREVVCEFDADNPGRWMVHCHNTYHAESGMMRVLGYTG